MVYCENKANFNAYQQMFITLKIVNYIIYVATVGYNNKH